MPSKDMEPTVTILMPAKNEARFIGKTLESVLAQDYPADRLEILVIDGMSTDRTPEIVTQLAQRHKNIRLLTNPQRLSSFGLNQGIREARGEYVVRMDAHTLYAPDYIRRCVELLQRGDAAEVGGVQRAIGMSYLTNAIALAMTFPFGVGNARFRYTDREIYAETVYLGAWRRGTLLELGEFKNQVNEDYELNCRLRKAGGRILVSPRIQLQYIVRRSLFGLVKQYAGYGFGKVQTLVKYPESILYRQIAAPLLVLSLVASCLIYQFSRPLGLVVPMTYLIADLCASVILAWRRGMRYLPLLPGIFIVMHLSYGIGFFGGVFRYGIPGLSFRPVLRSLVTWKGEPPRV